MLFEHLLKNKEKNKSQGKNIIILQTSQENLIHVCRIS